MVIQGLEASYVVLLELAAYVAMEFTFEEFKDSDLHHLTAF